MNARLKRPPNRLLAIGVVSVVVLAVMIAAVSLSASMSRRSGGGGGNGTMIVSDVGLSEFGNNRIRAAVEVKSNGAAVQGARVRAQLVMPTGKRFWVASETDESGTAVRFVRLAGPGTYELIVVDVSKQNMKFDSQGSVELDATLQVGGDNPPTPTEEEPTATETEEEPTATEEDPTATEEDPTATEEDPTATEEDPTATEEDPTATEEDPTATEEDPPSSPGGSSAWHAPSDHEHGDPPPQWATNYSIDVFGHGIVYGGDEQTPNEDAVKHNAFKGIAGSSGGYEMYARVHMQSNPHGRAGQFHSFEVFVRDPQGNVSMVQGWADFGKFPEDRGFRGPNGDPSNRPAIFGSAPGSDFGEQWYSRPGGPAASSHYGSTTSEITGAFATGWHPDFALLVLDATTYFDPAESGYVHDMDQWPVTGDEGTHRLGGFRWYGFRVPEAMEGMVFYATQFGQVAPGGYSDPICSGTTTVHGTTYQNKCLRQEIAPTLFQSSEIVFLNADQKINCPSCTLPN